MAHGLREGPHEIQMQGRETAVRHGERGQWGPGVPSDLGTLAGQALPTESLDLRRHPAPDKTPTKVTEESVASWMCKPVDVGKERLHQGRGNHRSGRRRCQAHVAEKATAAREAAPLQLEGGVRAVGRHLVRNRTLSSGQGLRVHRTTRGDGSHGRRATQGVGNSVGGASNVSDVSAKL